VLRPVLDAHLGAFDEARHVLARILQPAALREPASAGCSCVERCGDGLDNDCNGTADEASCVTCLDHEICGDGIDNNCDCVVDNCPSEEICGDGIDNDNDGFTDGDDPACFVIIR
jgi:hypothetical protein